MAGSKRVLSADQVDLLHHVELAEAGWRTRVIDQVCLSSLLEISGAISEDDLVRGVTGMVSASTKDVRGALGRLVGAGQAAEISVGRFVASEAARSDAADRQGRALALEHEARAEWQRALEKHAPGQSGDRLSWEWFVSAVLDPLVRIQGARTYELLVAGVPTDGGAPLALFDSLPEEGRLPARRVVDAFLSSPSIACRQHVLRRLHAHLLCLAAGLPPASVEALQSTGQVRQMKVLLDTNFVFSLLRLHENPSNEAAEALLSLLAQVRDRIDVTLYVSPLTVDEILRTLSGYEKQLDQIQITPKLGALASELDDEISGIARRFFDAAAQSKRRMTAKEYLGPYLENLTTILKATGIELYNVNLDDLTVSQPVIDDIREQESLDLEIAKRNPSRRPKSYASLRHDMTLWHLVFGRRPARLEAPLEAVYWLATLDYRLITFDEKKRSAKGASVPVCVHPSVLVQMLQLWLPRTPQFDEAVLDSLRTSLPRFFDGESEEISLRILRALSRYEDVDDLPESALNTILLNSALRARVATAPGLEQQADLVRDEIIQLAAATQRLKEQEQARVTELESQLRQVEERASTLSAGAKAAAENQAAALSAEIDQERARAKAVQEDRDRLDSLLQSERAERQASLVMAEKKKVRAGFAAVAVVGLLAIAFVAMTVSRRGVVPYGRKGTLMTVLVVPGLWASLTAAIGAQIAAVRDWMWFHRLIALQKWLWGTVILGIVLNLLASWLFT